MMATSYGITMSRLVSQCVSRPNPLRLVTQIASISRSHSFLSTSTVETRSRMSEVTSKSVFNARGCLCCSLVPVRLMAGHSKWQNIRHTKSAKDNERARAITQITHKIKVIIQETGNSDPKTNPSLARIVQEAKNKNLPNSNIESAIAQAVKSRDSSSIKFFEGRGPGGSYVIIEASTDKPIKTKNDLQGVLKKHGGGIGEQGVAKHAFDKKGVIEVGVSSENVDMDKFVDMAIEAGAEEVTMETDENEDNFLRFLCEVQDLYKVRKELEQRQLDVKSSSIEFLPVMTVFPQPKEMEVIGKMMDKLQDYPEVLRVFINVDAPDS